ncbi:MAG: glycosyltransferase [Tepidisphaeraceae bacterium]|jgi:glycosyltransferase involved in cell wall biosynthesis
MSLSPRPKSPEAARRLKIIQYCPRLRLELGGIVRTVLDWCAVLAARGHEVILVTYDSPDVPADWNGAGPKPRVVTVPPPRRPNGMVGKEALRIWENVLSGGGVAHLHCPWTASNLQMSKIARRLGVPYIVSIHGMLDDWSMAQKHLKKRLFLMIGGRRFLRRAARIHYSAAAERDQAQKWVGGSQPIVLPLLVDLAPFQILPGEGPARTRFPALNVDEPKLLFLSRLHEKKGADVLIEAAALLRDSGRTFKVFIAGSGAPAYQMQLQQRIDRLGLGGEVAFLGMVSGVEKISLYEAADLFILPTRQENFGMVLIEALAAATPVVTTRETDIWQEIQSAGGTIVDNTPQALCTALTRLLDDPGLLTALGERGRQWVLKHFEANSLAAGYETMYGELAI